MDGFIALLKIVFFMVYWPCKLLFMFGRWVFESAQDAKSAEQTRQYQALSTTREQQQEVERRKRNTLYREFPSEPEPEKHIAAPELPYHTRVVRAVRQQLNQSRRILLSTQEIRRLERFGWLSIVLILGGANVYGLEQFTSTPQRATISQNTVVTAAAPKVPERDPFVSAASIQGPPDQIISAPIEGRWQLDTAPGADGRPRLVPPVGPPRASAKPSGPPELQNIGSEVPVSVRAWRYNVAQKVLHYRAYPESARMSRQEGTPIIKVSINRGRRVADASVAQSSGFHTLDNAALKAVRDAEPYPAFPEEITADTIVVQISVPYSITDSFSAERPPFRLPN